MSSPESRPSPTSPKFGAVNHISEEGKRRLVLRLSRVLAVIVRFVSVAIDVHGAVVVPENARMNLPSICAQVEPQGPLTTPEVQVRRIKGDLPQSAHSGLALGEAVQHFANTDFSGVDLENADFRGADLTNADLSRSKSLEGAHLEYADLTGATLTGANLFRAHLQHAEIFCAALDKTNLSEANLSSANLTGSTLRSASLASTIFDNESDFQDVNLEGTAFEPQSLPSSANVHYALNLELLTFRYRQNQLIELRKRLRDAADEKEKNVTYAIKRRQAELAWERCTGSDAAEVSRGWQPDPEARRLWASRSFVRIGSYCIAYAFNRIGLDLTIQYGMNPARPLVLIAMFWAIFAIVYTWFIRRSTLSRIHYVRKRELRHGTVTLDVPIRPKPLTVPKGMAKWRVLASREAYIWRLAALFSLMAALNLGFKGVDFGRWLRMLTKREYELKPVGWIRTLSGIQSLLSVFLLALFIYSAFGHPFSD